MGRITTPVKPAVREYGSLRIVVPMAIRQVLDLKPGDTLEWELAGTEGDWYYRVRKGKEITPPDER